MGEGPTSDPLTTRAQGGRETEICASPDGGSAPPSDGDGTMPDDRRERPAEVCRERVKTVPFCPTYTLNFVT